MTQKEKNPDGTSRLSCGGEKTLEYREENFKLNQLPGTWSDDIKILVKENTERADTLSVLEPQGKKVKTLRINVPLSSNRKRIVEIRSFCHNHWWQNFHFETWPRDQAHHCEFVEFVESCRHVECCPLRKCQRWLVPLAWCETGISHNLVECTSVLQNMIRYGTSICNLRQTPLLFSWQLVTVQIGSITSCDTDYEDQRELIKILAPTFF